MHQESSGIPDSVEIGFPGPNEWISFPAGDLDMFSGPLNIFYSSGGGRPVSITDRRAGFRFAAYITTSTRLFHLPGYRAIQIEEISSIQSVDFTGKTPNRPRLPIMQFDRLPGFGEKPQGKQIVYGADSARHTIAELHGKGMYNEVSPVGIQAKFRSFDDKSLQQVFLIGSSALFGAGISALLEAFLASGILLAQRKTDSAG